jgi:UDP-N-acetylglucosamine diphosphorylase / glucose-1-phosphate thymidylyltransferase / UDP-N-acetylgalactosamine diphosphorylase / glucosamine-1-phosphate N-acetyltransferase / galactosamine-1-phosphate N-acetyltransferase
MQTTAEIFQTEKKRAILFENSSHWIENLLAENNECLALSLSVIGKPLIIHNVEKLILENQSIDHIFLPHGFTRIANLLQTKFPHIQIDEYADETGSFFNSRESLRIPLNSAVIDSNFTGHVIKPIVYPWDVLKVMLEILETEVKETSISKDASIADSTILKGPCVIDDGVFIDDFNKIIGPIYVGKNSKIGTGNLIRNCSIEYNSSVGFGCEIARSILIGKNKISHHDVILDSVIGENTWMGAFVGTTNLLLNNATIKYKLGDMMVSTALEHFGSVMGSNCAIGAGTIILPGRFVPPNSILQAGTIFSK